MTPVRLMFVTDPGTCRLGVEAVARAVADGGADAVQVRGFSSDRATVEVAERLVAGLRAWPVRVLVNERFDLALAAGAHGVHLKDGGLSAAEVRTAAHAAGAPSDFLVGVSAHDAAGLARAAAQGADHATIGPLREAHGRPGLGPAFVAAALESARRSGGLPPSVLILGGVEEADHELAVSLSSEACLVGLAAVRLFQDAPSAEAATALARRMATGLRRARATSI